MKQANERSGTAVRTQVENWQICGKSVLQTRRKSNRSTTLSSESSLQSPILRSLFDSPQSSSIPTSLSSSRTSELSRNRQSFEFSETVFEFVGECFGGSMDGGTGEGEIAKGWKRRKGSEESSTAISKLERDLLESTERGESVVKVRIYVKRRP